MYDGKSESKVRKVRRKGKVTKRKDKVGKERWGKKGKVTKRKGNNNKEEQLLTVNHDHLWHVVLLQRQAQR